MAHFTISSESELLIQVQEFHQVQEFMNNNEVEGTIFKVAKWEQHPTAPNCFIQVAEESYKWDNAIGWFLDSYRNIN